MPTNVPGNWNLLFNDDFSSPTLDTTKWNPNWYGTTPTAATTPVNAADTACESPAEVNTTNGYLSLGASTTPCTTNTGVSYPDTGSLIDTLGKFQFTYGYLEARMYIPATTTGQLVNMPAFWADGTGTWPNTGELDVMEVLNNCGPNSTSAGFGYHFISNSGNPGGCTPQDSTSGWHTFGADWQPGKVTYYYDGNEVGTVTEGITSSPMYLILDNTIDTTWGSHTAQTSNVDVDYVRVWQQTS